MSKQESLKFLQGLIDEVENKKKKNQKKLKIVMGIGNL